MKVSVALVCAWSFGLSQGANDVFKSNEERAKAFIEGKKDAKQQLFRDPEGFSKRGNLFEQIREADNAKDLLENVLNGIHEGAPKKPADVKRVDSFIKKINESEFNHILSIDHACTLVGPYMRGFSHLLQYVEDEKCINKMIRSALKTFPSGEGCVEFIPTKWVERNNKLMDHVAPVLPKVSKDLFQKLVEEPQNGALVDPDVFIKLPADKLSAVKPPFFANIREIGNKAELRTIVSKLPSSVFSEYEGRLHVEVAKAMTKEQFKTYNKEGKYRCANLPLSAMKSEFLKEASSECIISYLSKRRKASKTNVSRVNPALGARWKDIPSGFMKNFDEDAEKAIRGIHTEDRRFIPTATWNALLSNVDICAAFKSTDETFNHNGALVASPECFSKLKDNGIRQHILLNPAVNVEIFSMCNAEDLRSMKFTVGRNTYTGLQILNVIKSEKRAEIVKNISTNMVEGEHGCSSITDRSDFVKIAKWFNDASDECLASFGISFEAEDYGKYPFLLKAINEGNDLVEFYDGKWKYLSKETFKVLIKKGIIKHMGTEKLLEVNELALSAIDYEALEDIELKSIPKAKLKKFGNDAFAKMDFSFIEQSGLDSVSDQQLPHISTLLPDPSKRVTAKFTKEIINGLGKRFSLLSSLQLEALPAKMFAFISEAQFKGLSPESLTRVSYDQVVELDPKVLANITKEQAVMIGKEVKGEASPMKAILKSPDLKKEIIEVITARQNGVAKLGTSQFMLIVPAVLLAFLI